MTRKAMVVSAAVILPILLVSALGLRSFPFSGHPGASWLQHQSGIGLERQRPFEGRWTGLDYVPFRAGGLKKAASSPELVRTTAKILKSTDSNPESISDRALLSLISGDSDRAAQLLEDGAKTYPRNASLYNDEAVVYLTKAQNEGEPYQLILALSAIRNAVVLDGSLPEATFNYALILERLCLRKQSIRAWRRYLDLETDPQWSAEARGHLAILEAESGDPITAIPAAVRAGEIQQAKELVSSSAQQIRLHIEDGLLPDWARALERGDLTSAKSSLDLAESLSSLLLEISGDHLLPDAVAVVRNQQGAALKALIAAHRFYGEGSVLLKQGRYAQARDRFLSAEHYFEQSGSPLLLWAVFNAALCEYQRGNVDLAINTVLGIRERAIAADYLNLTGRIDWMVGLVRLERSDPAAALVSLRRAFETFQRTKERGHQGAISSLIANALTYIGDMENAWWYYFFAVTATVRSGDEVRLSVVYGSWARALLKSGQAKAALIFQNEALELDSIYDDPVRICESFWWRAMTLQDLGKASAALRDLESARERCSVIPEPATRDRNLAGLLVTEGAIRASLDPHSSVVVLTRALDLYKRSEYSYLLVDIYLERARALRRLSQVDAAEQDLAAAIDEHERQRSRVENLRQRISYFSRAGDAFDEMVDLQMEDRGDPQRAFEFSERSRARAALDSSECSRSGVCAGRPLSLQDILSNIPERTTLIQYHVLHDRLLIWILQKGIIDTQEVGIDRRELESLVDRFSVAIQARNEGKQLIDTSRELYRLLIQPVERKLNASNKIVIVPGDLLERVPFPGLQDSRTARFLIENCPISIAPSSTLYIAAAKAARGKPRGNPTSLAIGNPAFDRLTHPDLVNLPAAEIEARALAAREPRSVLLSGAGATIPRFLQEVGNHDFIHFGGHSLVDESVPGGSRLLFAPAQRGGGDLFGDDIARLRLTRPRLVVLSACNTGRGNHQLLEGVSDLAKPFLIAGVPSVVTNLWRVGDRESETFWGAFYDGLFAGDDVGSALRRAQLAMLRHREVSFHAPCAWAGYRLVGTF